MYKKLLISSVLAASALTLSSTPTFAATVGLSCADGAHIDFSVAGEPYVLSEEKSSCEIGFEVSGGYWALAAVEGHPAQGAAGGYSSQDGANAAAIASCEAQGEAHCAVASYGYDDGSGPAMAEPEMMEDHPAEMEMAEEMDSEEMMYEEEEPKLMARVKAVVLLVEVSHAE